VQASALDHNPDRFEIDLHVLAATITNCAFRNRHRWNAALNLWAFGKRWSAITYFVWGMVISVGVLLLNLIVSGVIAIFQPRLRKVSIWIGVVSVVMLVALVVLWRIA
jgi:hypothetical protein